MQVSLVDTFKFVKFPTTFDISDSFLSVQNGNEIVLQSISCSKVIPLKGHHHEISAINFGPKHAFLLSASSDYLITWKIDEVLDTFNAGGIPRGHIITSMTEAPSLLSVEEKLVCAVFNSYVNVYDIISKETINEIPLGNISCAKFLDNNNLIMSSYSGTVIAWDLLHHNEKWKAQMTHGFSYTSLAVCSDLWQIAVGSSTAVVQEFIFFNKTNQFEENVKIDLMERLLRTNQDWKESGDCSRGQVLDLIYLKKTASTSESYPTSSSVLCATERAIFHINLLNHEVKIASYPGCEIGTLFAKDVRLMQKDDKIFCAAVHIFEAKISIFSVWVYSDQDEATSISVLSSDPVLKSSPLSIQVKLSTKVAPPSDQPVTFKKKVKSSGYTKTPRTTMFKPKTSFTKQSSASKFPPIKKPISQLTFEDAPDWSNGVQEQPIIKISENPATVTCMAVNDRNERCAFALSDATTRIVRLPLPSNCEKSKVISGHNKLLIGCCWSHQSDVIMTYSPDRYVRVWESPFAGEAALQLEVACESKQKCKDLAHAQFYYLDKFILAAVGNSLLLYKYLLHTGPKDDVKRYLNQGKHKQVGSYPINDVQSITCVAAANHMFSYAVLCGVSDRSIAVMDTNRCEYIHRYSNAHTRAPHAIRLFTGSSYFSSTSCNCYVTTAPSDGIKLWDVRMKSCVRKFYNHPCVSKCDVTVSPCGRFVATATDNRAVFVYDVRSPIPLHTLRGKHKVTCLEFSKDSKQIFGGAENSEVYSWNIS
uniref:WD repeat-containing protein 27-like n=1 Tax=Phallusia mammillata TaxID=59560 RepID=A0A6F9DXE3_9ASCI|nr:WD repeat-containing protein 27-like [Phallusia mammillata]